MRRSRGAAVHVVTLVRGDPDVVSHGVVGKVGGQLAEVHDVGHAHRIVLYVLVGDEGIVLALVQLVTTGVIQRGAAQRVGLHVGLPSLTLGLKLIHNVGDVDGYVVVVNDAIGRAGSCRNVVRLTGMGHAKVVGRQTEVGSCSVDERCVGIPDQSIKTGVLHHDDEDVLKILDTGTTVLRTKRGRGKQQNGQKEQRDSGNC